ncbi:PLP-dependent aminotransferase family protein [Inquilinus limosus]|uniref:aminotransferase-like domain-containing protein n=1 Tax=Inquilinus limosus TaxID=171674 RepID=UPI000412138D|nr:PLP-dependent aminotransferase family protein [Inquilinus limosus]
MLEDFRRIADDVAGEIASGQWRPGDRLPPQRDFAYRRGIAASTAARVYAELRRRGLVSGEVGRGTFVRAAAPVPASVLAEPWQAPINLESSFPILPGQPAALAQGLQGLLRPDVLDLALRAVPAAGTRAVRAVAAEFLAQPGWAPEPAQVLFAGNGRQAIAAALSALAPVGGRVGVEALTYPVFKGIAARLGIALVPIAMDDEGLRPDALEAAHRAAPLRAVYLQPVLHNPLGLSMPPGRRAALAALLRRLDLVAIEDRVFSFLADEVPLAALAPDHAIVVDSLSKRLAPGLTLGFAVPPRDLVEPMVAAIRSGPWSPGGLALEAASRWMADGTVAALVAEKRQDARTRQAIARQALDGLEARGDPRAYHLWLELPEGWRAEAFAAAAARKGIALTSGPAYAAGPGHAPAAVRLALASPPHEVLREALATLARLARTDPDQIAVD